MKILKFGGKSLANGERTQKSLAILTDKVLKGKEFAVVVSGKRQCTDELGRFVRIASKNENYKPCSKSLKPINKRGLSNGGFVRGIYRA